MEGINNSLTRLDTAYVDLYQAHRYDHETTLEETMQAFIDVIRTGNSSTSVLGVNGQANPGQSGSGRAARSPLGVQPAPVLGTVVGHRGQGGPLEPGARAEADRVVAHGPGGPVGNVYSRTVATHRITHHRKQWRPANDLPVDAQRRAHRSSGLALNRPGPRDDNAPTGDGLGHEQPGGLLGDRGHLAPPTSRRRRPRNRDCTWTTTSCPPSSSLWTTARVGSVADLPRGQAPRLTNKTSRMSDEHLLLVRHARGENLGGRLRKQPTLGTPSAMVVAAPGVACLAHLR